MARSGALLSLPHPLFHRQLPYRLDIQCDTDDALDRLIELGAVDVECGPDGRVAALMPDSIAPQQIARTLGVVDIEVSPAVGRDADSVWVLTPRPIRLGANVLRLVDAPAFGTGLHPTTALCLEALEQRVRMEIPDAVLDVGTGSGVLALSALVLGVPRALAIDISKDALHTAAENARINGLEKRVQLAAGGPETVTGTWPLVFANILAAPLVEMAPALVRRVGHHGQLILSGIPQSVEQDVSQAYSHLGMRKVHATSRDGWVLLVFAAPW